MKIRIMVDGSLIEVLEALESIEQELREGQEAGEGENYLWESEEA